MQRPSNIGSCFNRRLRPTTRSGNNQRVLCMGQRLGNALRKILDLEIEIRNGWCPLPDGSCHGESQPGKIIRRGEIGLRGIGMKPGTSSPCEKEGAAPVLHGIAHRRLIPVRNLQFVHSVHRLLADGLQECQGEACSLVQEIRPKHKNRIGLFCIMNRRGRDRSCPHYVQDRGEQLVFLLIDPLIKLLRSDERLKSHIGLERRTR